MPGKGNPRFRLAADLIDEIESLAPQYGGRDALIRQALASLVAAGVAAKTESSSQQLREAVLELRRLVSELKEAVAKLDSAVQLIQGQGAPALRQVEPPPEKAAIVRQFLAAFEQMQGASQLEEP